MLQADPPAAVIMRLGSGNHNVPIPGRSMYAKDAGGEQQYLNLLMRPPTPSILDPKP
jgi:hypothetical protein